MSRSLLHGILRNFKSVQLQRVIDSKYIVKQNAVMYNQFVRFASSKEEKVPTKSNGKKIEAMLLLDNVEQNPENKKIEKQVEQKDGDHTRIWYIERIVSASLALVVPAALVTPCPALDVGMALAFVIHNYWALESVCVDYLNPSSVGTVIPKVVHILVVILSIATLAGLFCFIHDDVGIAQSFLCLWTVGKVVEAEPETEPEPEEVCP